MSASCLYCGNVHQGICTRVKSIEYADDGVTVRRVEFYPTSPPLTGLTPFNPVVGPGPQWSPGPARQVVYGPVLSNGTGD